MKEFTIFSPYPIAFRTGENSLQVSAILSTTGFINKWDKSSQNELKLWLWGHLPFGPYLVCEEPTVHLWKVDVFPPTYWSTQQQCGKGHTTQNKRKQNETKKNALNMRTDFNNRSKLSIMNFRSHIYISPTAWFLSIIS